VTLHPSDTTLGQFARGRLDAAGLLDVDDHLAQCAACRERAAALTGAASRADDLAVALRMPSDHLSDDDIQSFVGGRLRPTEMTAAREHLESCATCAQIVADLGQWTQAATRRRVPWLVAAAALVALVAIPALWWNRAARSQSETSLAGLATLSKDDQALVMSGASGAVVSLPEFFAGLKGAPEVLMGSSVTAAATFDLISPVATGVSSDRPTFEWQPLTGASGYVVSVFDETGNLVARSQTVDAPHWMPADPLPRERTYVWQVTTSRGGTTIVMPAPPAPQARFHVIDAHTADQLQRIQRDYPSSHLLLGILYARAGMPAAAIQQLDQVPLTDAHAADAARIATGLKSLNPASR